MDITKKETATLRKVAEGMHNTDRGYRRAVNYRFMVSLLYVVLLATGMRQFLGEPFLVQGSSMHPTLLDGERMLIEKVSYTFSRPERGDIVVCHYPGYTESCVKRVIGLPGDTVAIVDGQVYLNGIAYNESAYWQGTIRRDVAEHIVEQGHVFVMGDNRNDSKDSRDPRVGDIPYEKITGKAICVVWPFDAWRAL